MHPVISTTQNLCQAVSWHLWRRESPGWQCCELHPHGWAPLPHATPASAVLTSLCYPQKTSTCSSPGGVKAACTAWIVVGGSHHHIQHLCLFKNVSYNKAHKIIDSLGFQGVRPPFFTADHLGGKDRRNWFKDIFRCVFFLNEWMNES